MTHQPDSPYQITLNFQLPDPVGPLVHPDVTGIAIASPPLAEKPAIPVDDEEDKDDQDSQYVQANLDLGGKTAHVIEPSQQSKPTAISSTHPADHFVPTEVLEAGAVLLSPGGHFTYRVLGACCRLFDREELPWPCCRLQWRGKEPSWRRIGKRFVPDMATKRFPSYAVEILDHDYSDTPVIVTVYWQPLSPKAKQWWYRRYVPGQP